MPGSEATAARPAAVPLKHQASTSFIEAVARVASWVALHRREHCFLQAGGALFGESSKIRQRRLFPMIWRQNLWGCRMTMNLVF